MDAKITKQRVSRLLSYDWLKIIGIILAGIIFWSFIFTVTATRISSSQQFMVFNHYANVSWNKTSYYTHYEYAVENGVFSHEVIEMESNDLTDVLDQKHVMCETRLSTGQGDMMFVPNILDTEKTTDTMQMTYVESFMARYRKYIITWDEFLIEGREYLNKYYQGDYVNGELNETLVESDFRAYVEETNDKRYRRKSKLEAGVQGEIERIAKYRDGFVQFEKYIKDGVVEFVNVVYKDEYTGEPHRKETGEIILQGNFALNICPDETRMSGLKNLVAYEVTTEDGQPKRTAQNMCVMVFSLEEMNQDYQYETVLYLNTVIAKSLAA